MVFAEIVQYHLSWLNSCWHIWRLCFHMSFAERKLNFWFIFYLERTLHVWLWRTGSKWLMTWLYKLEFLTFPKDSWTRQVIWFFKILIFISQAIHHLHEVLVGWSELSTTTVNFWHTNNIGVKLFKMLFHEPFTIIELNHWTVHMSIIKVVSQFLGKHIPMS